ncbi:hypothetical protein [Rhizobium leguminosarum]|uniref:hypothetical protein n=1 Tax=Rhizobium leguminosarum TaxID=384 RepID=UPI003F95C1D3
MADTPRQLRDELNDAVRALKVSVDRRSASLTLEQRVILSTAVDRVRVVARQISITPPFFFRDEVKFLSEIVAVLKEVFEESAVGDQPVRQLPASGRTGVSRLTQSGVTNSQLVKYLTGLIDDIPDDLILEANDLQLGLTQDETVVTHNLNRLMSEIVPEQKISPVQFEIVADVLVITHSLANANKDDADNVLSARAALIEQGLQIVEEMRQSNCDRRFLSDFIALQRKLETSEDIIQLGIMNLACEEQRKQFEKELPDVIASKLRSHMGSVAMYVAQFQDWARFTENAAAVELSESDIRKAKAIAGDIAQAFEKMPETVSPEVPKTIRLIREAISDPAIAGKRSAFALVRTLENLFIRVFGYTAQFMDQSAEKTISLGSRAVAIGFGTAILGYAGSLVSIYEKVPGMAWLGSAVEIFGKFVATLGA